MTDPRIVARLRDTQAAYTAGRTQAKALMAPLEHARREAVEDALRAGMKPAEITKAMDGVRYQTVVAIMASIAQRNAQKED